MTHTEQAIRKAIEGGYELSPVNYAASIIIDDRAIRISNTFLMPLFWQALGMALGWKCPAGSHKAELCGMRWKYEWHRFIDHLIEQKDPEEFFKQILQ